MQLLPTKTVCEYHWDVGLFEFSIQLYQPPIQQLMHIAKVEDKPVDNTNNNENKENEEKEGDNEQGNGSAPCK